MQHINVHKISQEINLECDSMVQKTVNTVSPDKNMYFTYIKTKYTLK